MTRTIQIQNMMSSLFNAIPSARSATDTRAVPNTASAPPSTPLLSNSPEWARHAIPPPIRRPRGAAPQGVTRRSISSGLPYDLSCVLTCEWEDVLVAPSPFQNENVPRSGSSKSGRMSKNDFRSKKRCSVPRLGRGTRGGTFVAFGEGVEEDGVEVGPQVRELLRAKEQVLPPSLEDLDTGPAVHPLTAHMRKHLRVRFDDRVQRGARMDRGGRLSEQAVDLRVIRGWHREGMIADERCLDRNRR